MQSSVREQYSSRDFMEFEDTCDYKNDDTAKELSKIDFQGVLVDIGCGYGPYLEILKPKFQKPNFKKYIGIEPNDYLRGLAEEKAKNLGIKCEFLKGVAEKIPLEDKCADFVIATYSLNEVRSTEKIRKALKEIRRITKPKGTLIICDLTGGVKDGYTKIQTMADFVRDFKNPFYAELADIWIEILLFLERNTEILRSERVNLRYKFESRMEAFQKSKAIIPDIETNEKVEKVVREFYKKPVLSSEGLFIIAKFKN